MAAPAEPWLQNELSVIRGRYIGAPPKVPGVSANNAGRAFKEWFEKQNKIKQVFYRALLACRDPYDEGHLKIWTLDDLEGEKYESMFERWRRQPADALTSEGATAWIEEFGDIDCDL